MFPNLLINEKLSNLIFIFSLCTLSFRLFNFYGYAVPLSAVPLAVFILTLKQINKTSNLIVGTLIVYFLILFLFYLPQDNPTEFLKTFTLASITIFIFSSSFICPCAPNLHLDILKVIQYSILAITIFEFLQVFEFVVLHETKLWFIFDSISTSTAVDPNRFLSVIIKDFIRPISFFHEPGYLATVLLTLVIVWRAQKISSLYIILATAGIFLSFSGGVIIFTLTYYMGCLFLKSRKLFWGIVICLIVLMIFKSSDLISVFRLNEINFSGTSGYMRITEPFIEVLSLLLLYPLGVPLGNNTYIFNNSFFLIVSYFGYLSLAVYGLLVFAILKKIKLNIDRFSYFIVLLSVLFCNGSIFTLTTAFLLLLINISFFKRGCCV